MLEELLTYGIQMHWIGTTILKYLQFNTTNITLDLQAISASLKNGLTL